MFYIYGYEHSMYISYIHVWLCYTSDGKAPVLEILAVWCHVVYHWEERNKEFPLPLRV